MLKLLFANFYNYNPEYKWPVLLRHRIRSYYLVMKMTDDI